MTSDEQEELRLARTVNVITYEERSSMESSVGEIDSLTARVRDQSRQRYMSAPGVLGRFETAASDSGFEDENFHDDLIRLEDLIGKKAMLESIVLIRSTSSFLSLTISGRKTLDDLSVWMDRFGTYSFSEFRIRMDDLKNSMANSVFSAELFMNMFESREPGMIRPELRGPALIAGINKADPDVFAEIMSEAPEDEVQTFPQEDHFFASTFAASSRGGEQYLLSEYERTRRDLRIQGMQSDEEIKAASIVGLAPEVANDRVERMKWIQANMVLPDQGDVAWLAGSAYPVEEAKARYDQLMQTLNSLGYQENTALRSSCAILAGSTYAVQDAAGRFADLAGELKIVFESPYVASAMLASSALAPKESMHVFREAVGVISRANYFDDAGEIENLALLLTNKITPASFMPAQGTVGTEQAIAPQMVSAEQQASEAQRQHAPWFFWYYWNMRYYYRPLIWHARQHPGHMHTVPYFG